MIFLIASLSMLIDHIGYIFFPQEITWRIIGRLAFPLFAWGIVRGYSVTSSRWKYFLRLSILAGVSQVIWWRVFWTGYNVIFTFLAWILLFMVWDIAKSTALSIQSNFRLWNFGGCFLLGELLIFLFLIAFCIVWVADFLDFDYRWFWVLFLFVLYVFPKIFALMLSFILIIFYRWFDVSHIPSCLYMFDIGEKFSFCFHIQFLSLLWLALLYFTPIVRYDFRIPTLIKYSFYPLHLLVLYLIAVYTL